MATTRAVVAVAYGGPEQLHVVEVDPGEPGPGEVLLDVRAAAVNPVDWKSYAAGDPARLPLRLGLEVAGTVAATGPNVRWLSEGDEVIAWRVDGGYAGALVVPEQSTVRRPPTLPWAEASGLMVTGTTAVHTLTATRTRTGDVVLVHGGSGGVGRMVTQLALLRGAHVVATASPDAHDDLRELGAVPVAHGEDLVRRVRAALRDAGLGPATVAIDTVGTDEALEASVELVRDRGSVVTVAGFGRAAELGIRALGGGPGADPGTQVREQARAQLVELAGDGSLDVRVARTYPLEEVALAHTASRGGHARGKLVLLP
ncbi:quinone oxidoreductase family protein [Cellulomonas fulva]|uniref:quinone oxidoreductase family protein n=1 Tax=Cellulomonas fulva TaxID=2835530 RepID=UPI0027DD1620|nr:NADP-dependent oxidoreductase [Cellulomonas fulva]